MFGKLRNILFKHIQNNMNTYIFLMLAFIIGVSAGAFTVNGLSTMQREELSNYFMGFLQLMGNQNIDSSELLKISIMDNMKIVMMLWILGVTIIGIPLIFLTIVVRGFITGFTSGFLVQAMGAKGVLFALFTLFPKEVVIIPCIIALGVSGINFSMNIIKKRSVKRISRENLKRSFISYCFVTVVFSGIIFTGILIEAYVTPVLIRMVSGILLS